MPSPSKQQRGFVKYLCRLAQEENRAALAALRRGLGKAPGTTPEMFRYVEPWLSAGDRHADDYYLVASLFALHPETANNETANKENLGTTFAAMRREGNHEAEDSLEKRFVALLNAHEDDLPEHLRHAVSLARALPVPVNWANLLADVAYWGHEDRFVQRQWAGEYWGKEAPASAPVENLEQEAGRV